MLQLDGHRRRRKLLHDFDGLLLVERNVLHDGRRAGRDRVLLGHDQRLLRCKRILLQLGRRAGECQLLLGDNIDRDDFNELRRSGVLRDLLLLEQLRYSVSLLQRFQLPWLHHDFDEHGPTGRLSVSESSVGRAGVTSCWAGLAHQIGGGLCGSIISQNGPREGRFSFSTLRT